MGQQIQTARAWSNHLGQVVERVDNTTHRINHSTVGNKLLYSGSKNKVRDLLNSDLSGGQHHPSFEQLGTEVSHYCVRQDTQICWVVNLRNSLILNTAPREVLCKYTQLYSIRGFIKGGAQSKLTGCENDLARLV